MITILFFVANFEKDKWCEWWWVSKLTTKGKWREIHLTMLGYKQGESIYTKGFMGSKWINPLYSKYVFVCVWLRYLFCGSVISQKDVFAKSYMRKKRAYLPFSDKYAHFIFWKYAEFIGFLVSKISQKHLFAYS